MTCPVACLGGFVHGFVHLASFCGHLCQPLVRESTSSLLSPLASALPRWHLPGAALLPPKGACVTLVFHCSAREFLDFYGARGGESDFVAQTVLKLPSSNSPPASASRVGHHWRLHVSSFECLTALGFGLSYHDEVAMLTEIFRVQPPACAPWEVHFHLLTVSGFQTLGSHLGILPLTYIPARPFCVLGFFTGRQGWSPC